MASTSLSGVSTDPYGDMGAPVYHTSHCFLLVTPSHLSSSHTRHRDENLGAASLLGDESKKHREGL